MANASIVSRNVTSGRADKQREIVAQRHVDRAWSGDEERRDMEDANDGFPRREQDREEKDRQEDRGALAFTPHGPFPSRRRARRRQLGMFGVVGREAEAGAVARRFDLDLAPAHAPGAVRRSARGSAR